MRAILLSLLLLLTFTTLVAAASLAGTTQMTYSPGHGTQIEYLANGGGAWLWYPGNANIVVGEWKVEGADLCL